MSANRKLQTEIQGVLKKVEEGVLLFDDIWEKVYAAGQQSLKEKYEGDLKKEIKKLQRLRDQIKTWLGSNEIKDKSQLTEARKIIETKMEQFKICEKDTKTKAYSKEGLDRASRLDPKEAEREEKRDWLNGCLERLNDLIDSIDADIGKVSSGRGKAKNKEQIEKLENRTRKNRWHIARLEQILKLVDNYDLDPSKLDSVKDDVEYYIESAADDDGALGVDDEFDIYEELQLDSITESVAAAAAAALNDEEDGVEAEGKLTPSPGDQSPLASHENEPEAIAPSAHQAKAIASAASVPLVASVKKPLATTATAVISSSGITPSSAGVSSLIGRPNAAATRTAGVVAAGAKATPAGPVAGAKSVPPLPPSAASAAAKSSGAAANAPAAAKPTAPSMGSAVKMDLKQVMSQSARTDNALVAAAGSTNAEEEKAPAPPTWGPSKAAVAASASAVRQAPTVASTPSLSGSNPVLEQAMHTISSSSDLGIGAAKPSIIDLASSDVAAALQQQQQQSFRQLQPPQPPTSDQAPAFNQTSGFYSNPSAVATAQNPPPDAYQQQQPQTSTQQSYLAIQRNISNSLSPEAIAAAGLLRYSMLCSPENSELDKLSNYVVRNPYITHPAYPTQPPSLSESASLIEKLPMDSLFFSFYYQPGSYQQYLAARQLKKHSWRFHKKYMTWFQRHEEPKIAGDDYEEGTYVYFDYESGWCQRIKQEFKFEYAYLEDELISSTGAMS